MLLNHPKALQFHILLVSHDVIQDQFSSELTVRLKSSPVMQTETVKLY